MASGQPIYFVLTANEDGIRIEAITQEDLTRRLDQNYYGEDVEWDRALAPHRDLQATATKVIIKGKIVVPIAEERVIHHRLP